MVIKKFKAAKFLEQLILQDQGEIGHNVNNQYIVTGPVRLEKRFYDNIYLLAGIFEDGFSCGEAEIGSFGCGSTVFKRGFDCDAATIGEFRCENAVFHKNLFLPSPACSFDCNNAVFNSFRCGDALFNEDFCCSEGLFRGPFYCETATFRKQFVLDPSFSRDKQTTLDRKLESDRHLQRVNDRIVQFQTVFSAPNHPEIAQKILYWKQGVHT